ncbi:VCBS domain-containing protein, partial [Shimia thalassica]|uniref:VCBS domain-containing protein n=1 Tax=Shimia thalassica TaxID=1715693 RepID=UPI0024955844
MSDQNSRKSKASRSATDSRDELSEEIFAWVVSDTSDLPDVEAEDAHTAPDDVDHVSATRGNRQLMVSAPALARHLGVGLSELHSEPGRPGAQSGSDWLATSGLTPLPPAQNQTSGSELSDFTHALPNMDTGTSVGHAIIPAVPTGGGGHLSGPTPSHVVTGGQSNGPAIAGLIPSGKEGNPVPVLISVVNGNNTPGGSTVTIGGLPPGTIMNHGHAGPNGTWILSPGTDLKNLTMTPPTDWFGSGHLTATVVDPSGQSAQVQMPFNVLPQPDAAQISGTGTGTTSEDLVLTVSGTLTIVDPDPGESNFRTTSLTGSYGHLQIDQSGHWTYTLENTSPAVQALVSGQSERETFTIHSVDGTSHQLVVNVMGTNDQAIIAGASQGAVTEDKLTSTGGKLDVTDPDAGQDHFVAQTGAAGAHGSFTVKPDGTWSYTLDNSQPAVQALKTGDQITDTLTVSTVDGTTQQITVTINGTDDKAAIAGTAVGAVTEDKLTSTGGKLDVTDPDAGQD